MFAGRFSLSFAAKLSTLLQWLGCYGFFKLAQAIAVFFAFPIGGGAFHAMFAYSESGREQPALVLWALLVVSAFLCNLVLQFYSEAVPWWGLAIVSSVASFEFWGSVTGWSPVSPEFRQFATTLAWCLPLACFLSSWAVRWGRLSFGRRDG